MKFKFNLNHIPRRLQPTAVEATEIRGNLHLRAQLPPDDPNKLAVAEGAKHSWGGALWWQLGCLRQDDPIFLGLGGVALLYVLVVDPLINLFH